MSAVAADLRVFATLDTHGGKVSQRVEVLVDAPDPRAGLVAVRGRHPLDAADEHPDDPSDALERGVPAVGWVAPESLRDWYRPDRLVVSEADAVAAGLDPGLYADTRTRGRVRVADPEGHLGPDGRPAFRALTGPVETPTLDTPLPREEAVRLVSVELADDGDGMVALVSRPVLHVLSPGVYPDHAGDLPGTSARPASRSVRIRAFVIVDGTRHEVDRVDEQAHTMWVHRDGRAVPFAVSAFGPDLVRYSAEPA